jgi:tetratricopeptide (TPR) repeat protein
MKRPLLIILVGVIGIGGFLYCRDNPEVLSFVMPVSTPETNQGPTATPASAKPSPAIASPQPTETATADPAPDIIPGATLLQGLGDYHFPISSNNLEARKWFDQGLMLYYGFNHDAAERSFMKATEIDIDCAMCWWGAALTLGPHVNSGMDPANNANAWTRVQKAQTLSSKATPREQSFIKALSARYSENPPENRKALDIAYANAAANVAKEFPEDPDAATLYAEAMMDLQPWDYYDNKLRPKGNTKKIVATLEEVIKQFPDHAGALHLYVHAVEASADPAKGVAAADHLRTLIPASGHLVHMPAHIYSRVGRWHDAVLANQIAIKADDDYLAICRGNAKGLYPLGYVPHNHHFLWFAASMEGSSSLAKQAAEKTAEKTNLPDLMRQPGNAGLQHYWMTPWFDRVRFGRWNEIVGQANPAPDLPYVTAIWHYAQGMAAIQEYRMDDAMAHLQSLKKLAADPEMEKLTVWDRYPLSHAVNIAELTLRGEIAAFNGNKPGAVAALQKAVLIEDKIPYDEPPGWHSPTRQTLGQFLLDFGRAAEAEKVYREDLARNPENGWSLFGLSHALRAQRRTAEADEMDRRFKAAWKNADVTLVASRF